MEIIDEDRKREREVLIWIGNETVWRGLFETLLFEASFFFNISRRISSRCLGFVRFLCWCCFFNILFLFMRLFKWERSSDVFLFYCSVEKKKFPWGYQSALPLERLLIHLEIICKLTLSPFCSVLFKRYLFWWGRCYESMRIHE